MKSTFSIPRDQLDTAIGAMVDSRFTTANNLKAQEKMDQRSVGALVKDLLSGLHNRVNNAS